MPPRSPYDNLVHPRTVKKPGRPSVLVAEKSSDTSGLSTERKVSPIAPKQAAHPEAASANRDSGTEKDAA